MRFIAYVFYLRLVGFRAAGVASDWCLSSPESQSTGGLACMLCGLVVASPELLNLHINSMHASVGNQEIVNTSSSGNQDISSLQEQCFVTSEQIVSQPHDMGSNLVGEDILVNLSEEGWQTRQEDQSVLPSQMEYETTVIIETEDTIMSAGQIIEKFEENQHSDSQMDVNSSLQEASNGSNTSLMEPAQISAMDEGQPGSTSSLTESSANIQGPPEAREKLQCFHCVGPKTFDSASLLHQHHLKSHKRCSTCHLCGLQLTQQAALRRHYFDVPHIGCSFCSQYFTSQQGQCSYSYRPSNLILSSMFTFFAG